MPRAELHERKLRQRSSDGSEEGEREAGTAAVEQSPLQRAGSGSGSGSGKGKGKGLGSGSGSGSGSGQG